MAMAIEWDNHGIHSGEKWFIVIKHPRMGFNTPKNGKKEMSLGNQEISCRTKKLMG